MQADPSNELPIFISYARSDGASSARSLREDLVRRGFRVWQDVQDMQGGERWWRQIIETISGSAVLVLLITPGAIASPVVFDEFVHARSVGTPVLPVILHDVSIVSRLPSWLSEIDIFIIAPENPDSETTFERLLNQLKHPPARRPRPRTAPSLPQNIVERREELRAVLDLILDHRKEQRVARVVGLYGPGGFGKTTVAAAVCCSERVRTIFDDGVLWLQFREHSSRADTLAIINEQIRLLDPSAELSGDIGIASSRFHALLADRKVLVVLDDLWSESHLPFLLHEGATYLVTTRVDAVLVRARASRVWVGELAAEEGRALLVRWLSTALSPTDERALGFLGERLGEWALLLELVGAELRSLVEAGLTLANAIEHVERRLAAKITHLDRPSEDDRNSAIEASLDASVGLLPTGVQARFYELAMFPPGEELPFATVLRLWAATAELDELAGEDALEAMRRLSLFTRYDAPKRTLRIHDVVRKLLLRRAGDLKKLHRKLVEAWSDLHALPDTYAWLHVLYHLEQLGEPDRIAALLYDFDWLYRKLQATTPFSLVGDVAEYGRGRDGHLLRAALQMSGPALLDPAQLAAQLVGRLQGAIADSSALSALVHNAKQYVALPSFQPLSARFLPASAGVHSRIHVGAVILSAAITPSGDELVIGRLDGQLEIWDWRARERRRSIACGVGGIWSLSLMTDHVAVGGKYFSGVVDYVEPQAPIQLWNWRTGEHVRDLGADIRDVDKGYMTTICGALAFITNSGVNNRVDVLDLLTGSLAQTLNSEDTTGGNRPGAVEVAGHYLLYSTGGYRYCEVYEIDGWRYIGQTNGRVDGVSRPFVAGGRLCIRAQFLDDPQVPGFIFQREAESANAETPCADRVLEVFGYYPSVTATLSLEGFTLIASGADMFAYDPSLQAPPLVQLEGHSENITSLHAADDAIISTSIDQTIRVWDRKMLETQLALARDRSLTVSERQYTRPISELELAGDSVFASTWSGFVHEYDAASGQLRQEIRARAPIHAFAVNAQWLVYSAFFEPKRTSFSVSRREGWADHKTPGALYTDYLGDPEQGGVELRSEAVLRARLMGDACAMIVKPYYTPLNSLGHTKFTGNRIVIAQLARDNELELAVGEWISAMAISADFVAGGSADGTICVWQRPNGEPRSNFAGHSLLVRDLQIEGGLLYSCGNDNMVRVWRLPDCASLQTFGPFEAQVVRLQIALPLLVLTLSDFSVRIVDTRTGRELARLDDDVPITRALMSLEHRLVAMGGSSGYLHLLRMNEKLCSRFE